MKTRYFHEGDEEDTIQKYPFLRLPAESTPNDRMSITNRCVQPSYNITIPARDLQSTIHKTMSTANTRTRETENYKISFIYQYNKSTKDY